MTDSVTGDVVIDVEYANAPVKGQLKMLINGFWPRDPSELNWVFYIQASSPTIRIQADGYPGIPIIGRQELDEYRKKKLC